MKINERLLEYRIRYPFLLIDYIFWLIFDISKFNSVNKKDIKKIIVIHSGAIGEIVAATPILRALKEEFKCELHCAVKKSMFELLKDNPNVDDLIEYRSDSSIIETLKKEKYDVAVIFQASFKNSFICYKSGIKHRIGGYSRIKRFPTFLYSRRTFPIALKHTLDYSFDIIKKIGVSRPKSPKTEIYIDKKSRIIASKLLNKYNIKKYAVIHPGFGPLGKKSPPREWEPEKYAKISDYLSEKYGLDVIITGLKEQGDIIKSIINKTRNKNKNRIHDFSGKTRLLELCYLLSKAEIVLAPDTGASHLTASFGVPLINLIDAPVHEWSPIGNEDRIINIHHPREIVLFEKGKLYKKIGGVRSIEVEEVKKAINKILKRKIK
jgi:ADP-heptose:LPS heptosyltransferase